MILSNVYAMHVGFVHIIDKCRLAYTSIVDNRW